MSKPKLKPCPFCDSDNVEILPYVDSFTKNGIRCLNCECVTTFKDCKHTDNELAQLWNKRANEKHGKWIGYTRSAYLNILDKNDNPIERECKYYRCDKCRFGLVYKSNYCPNCGAKMKEEKQ